MPTPVLAYLDAGTGAALAAVVASGAVGARAVFGSAKGKLRRKSARSNDDQPVAPTDDGRPTSA